MSTNNDLLSKKYVVETIQKLNSKNKFLLWNDFTTMCDLIYYRILPNNPNAFNILKVDTETAVKAIYEGNVNSNHKYIMMDDYGKIFSIKNDDDTIPYVEVSLLTFFTDAIVEHNNKIALLLLNKYSNLNNNYNPLNYVINTSNDNIIIFNNIN